MASYKTIEDLVRHYVPFVHGEAKGWNRVYCEACGDGSRTKGPRGGWLFQDEVAFYHCFNCGVDASFDPERQHPRSKEFARVVTSFGVPDGDVKMIEFLHKGTQKRLTGTLMTKAPIEVLSVPDHFYALTDDPSNSVASEAVKFLRERRIEPESYRFFLSTGISKTDSTMAKNLVGRLIVPAFRGDNLIYYQARRLDGIEKNKYISCGKPRTNIIYNMDRLYEDIRSPLFVSEGFFDSHHLNGVSVMENHLSQPQIDLLNRSPRKKVIVPDYKGDSMKLIEQGLKEGWGVTAPRFGSEVKDTTEAVQRYGRLFVAHEVITNIKFGQSARVAARMMNLLK